MCWNKQIEILHDLEVQFWIPSKSGLMFYHLKVARCPSCQETETKLQWLASWQNSQKSPDEQLRGAKAFASENYV